jgi:hypothetical protein
MPPLRLLAAIFVFDLQLIRTGFYGYQFAQNIASLGSHSHDMSIKK